MIDITTAWKESPYTIHREFYDLSLIAQYFTINGVVKDYYEIIMHSDWLKTERDIGLFFSESWWDKVIVYMRYYKGLVWE